MMTQYQMLLAATTWCFGVLLVLTGLGVGLDWKHTENTSQ
jgi:hypothetical protein